MRSCEGIVVMATPHVVDTLGAAEGKMWRIPTTLPVRLPVTKNVQLGVSNLSKEGSDIRVFRHLILREGPWKFPHVSGEYLSKV